MACMFPGCTNFAPNYFGVRLRYPRQGNAVWAPNTGAFMCDQHAGQGAKIEVTIESADTGYIETSVSAGGPPVVKRTPIALRHRRVRGAPR